MIRFQDHRLLIYPAEIMFEFCRWKISSPPWRSGWLRSNGGQNEMILRSFQGRMVLAKHRRKNTHNSMAFHALT